MTLLADEGCSCRSCNNRQMRVQNTSNVYVCSGDGRCRNVVRPPLAGALVYKAVMAYLHLYTSRLSMSASLKNVDIRGSTSLSARFHSSTRAATGRGETQSMYIARWCVIYAPLAIPTNLTLSTTKHHNTRSRSRCNKGRGVARSASSACHGTEHTYCRRSRGWCLSCRLRRRPDTLPSAMETAWFREVPSPAQASQPVGH